MKVYHAPRTRSLRVLWMLEEMGLAYEVEVLGFPPSLTNPEFLAVNPAGTVPVLRDGETLLLESGAILEYLAARHGPTDLAVAPSDPDFPLYVDFLHYGEATLAAPLSALVRTKFMAPEAEKANWTANRIARTFQERLVLLERRLELGPFVIGDRFTAADISVTYGLFLGRLLGLHEAYAPAVKDYFKRMRARPAYERAVAV